MCDREKPSGIPRGRIGRVGWTENSSGGKRTTDEDRPRFRTFEKSPKTKTVTIACVARDRVGEEEKRKKKIRSKREKERRRERSCRGFIWYIERESRRRRRWWHSGISASEVVSRAMWSGVYGVRCAPCVSPSPPALPTLPPRNENLKMPPQRNPNRYSPVPSRGTVSSRAGQWAAAASGARSACAPRDDDTTSAFG